MSYFQNPFLPWLGPSPWPSGNIITSITTTPTPTTEMSSTPTMTAVPAPAETTEFLKIWAYGEQLGILKWCKGIAGGVAVALLLAAMFCCWAPCIYWYYGGDFSHQDGLDDMTDAILRGQFTPEGGWIAWFRARAQNRAQDRGRAALEEGAGDVDHNIGSDNDNDASAGDANGYAQGAGMSTARNRHGQN
ncbi:hypothetical protein CH063_08820 [Colletotrichum higginsianum]|uniref:Uncharacterized protein n=2 Tax=Colletotrichum higginsianum TaxID=80884 RepID=H1VBB0_COLHI|nr:hypothetical protein CH63R_01949 [Colletotrichum higginsianum IMI 349063]OBR13223.1 hypothetical protein CH63R_01949 [Colletotrichum higginsianum IMI 349063]CCF37513.1 hypothetical protein CH063_08820 [Colletotrichum higginsianum]